MRYSIIKYDIFNKTRERLTWTSDACEAYEWAHELDASINIGMNDDQSDKSEHPCIVTIEDDDGNSAWDECARARCPSVGIFR